MAIVLTEVLSEYGAYYLNSGQNQNDLMQKLHRPSVTAAEFALLPTDQTRIQKGNSALTRVLQPWQKGFTPIGDLTFTPNPIDLYKIKVDVQMDADDIEDSWLGFLAGTGIDRALWPIIRFFIEQHVILQAQEDFELNEVYHGVYAAPTPGTAGAAGTSMNGIKKILTDNVADINVISMGAIPVADEDVVTYVEDFVAQMSKEYRKRATKLYMNEDVHLQYRRGKRSKYNQHYAQETDVDRVIDFPQMSVMGLPSMGTDSKIWTTIPGNMIRPLKRAEFSNFKVGEYSPRQISMYTDFWTVCSFNRFQDVFTNDL